MQVVLPEDLCNRLTDLAERESRTVSNMAKVLIQEGVKQYEQTRLSTIGPHSHSTIASTEGFRSALEVRETKRLRGAPRRLRLYRKS